MRFRNYGSFGLTVAAAMVLGLPLWSQNISSVAGNSTWNDPFTVRLDAAGNMYVPDFYNHVVYKVDSTGAQTIVAGTYQKAGFTGDGNLATNAELNNPSGVVPAPDGTLYICDWSNNRIRKVAPNGIITTLVGSATPGFQGDGGPVSAALVHSPMDIVLDAAGNILFVDYSNYRIRKITPAGIISTVAGSGTPTYSGDGASALQAGMFPYAIAVGPNGNIYFTDSGAPVIGGRSYRVRMVANGIITTVAGNATFVDSGDGGPASAAGLGFPSGVAVDSAGNVYIADQSNVVRKVSADGTITPYAGTGGRGLAGDGGPALQATLYGPRGMTVDSTNNLYIADTFNNRIRKVSSAPAIKTNGLVNGASFVSGGLVPGEIATIFGTNLTTALGINLAGALPLATKLQNVQVMVNGTAAPLFAVDNVNGLQQVNFQVPYEVAGLGTTATVQVVNNGSPGNTITVPVIAAQPGIFTYTVGPTTFGAILHANYQLANTSNPAVAGETVQIFCTGLGAVTPTPVDGVGAVGSSMTVATTTVTIGGVDAPVAYAGLAPGFVGEYQVNAQVPSGLPTGNQPVIVTVGGTASSIALLPIQ